MTMQITDRQGNDREREFSKFYSWEDSDGKDVSADNLAELKMDFEVLGSELPDSVESPEEAAQAIVDEIMRFIREEIPFNVSVNNRTRRNRKTGKMETRSFTTIEGLISE